MDEEGHHKNIEINKFIQEELPAKNQAELLYRYKNDKNFRNEVDAYYQDNHSEDIEAAQKLLIQMSTIRNSNCEPEIKPSCFENIWHKVLLKIN